MKKLIILGIVSLFYSNPALSETAPDCALIKRYCGFENLSQENAPNPVIEVCTYEVVSRKALCEGPLKYISIKKKESNSVANPKYYGVVEETPINELGDLSQWAVRPTLIKKREDGYDYFQAYHLTAPIFFYEVALNDQQEPIAISGIPFEFELQEMPTTKGSLLAPPQ